MCLAWQWTVGDIRFSFLAIRQNSICRKRKTGWSALSRAGSDSQRVNWRNSKFTQIVASLLQLKNSIVQHSAAQRAPAQLSSFSHVSRCILLDKPAQAIVNCRSHSPSSYPYPVFMKFKYSKGKHRKPDLQTEFWAGFKVLAPLNFFNQKKLLTFQFQKSQKKISLWLKSFLGNSNIEIFPLFCEWIITMIPAVVRLTFNFRVLQYASTTAAKL